MQHMLERAENPLLIQLTAFNGGKKINHHIMQNPSITCASTKHQIEVIGKIYTSPENN